MEMLLTSAASASQGLGQGAPQGALPWGRSIGPVLASRIRLGALEHEKELIPARGGH
jgi:hypothetical protein